MSKTNGAVVSHEEIAKGVEALQRAVAEWKADENAPRVNWLGSPRHAINQAIQEQAEVLFEIVNTMAIDPKSRALVLAIDRFDDVFCHWADRCTAAPEQTDPAGTPAVWQAYSELIEALTPRHFPRPEPIQALVQQKIPYRQIAKMYGFKDEGGNPDLDKVQQELTKPGTHYDPKTWKHPAQARYEASLEQEWSERPNRIKAPRTLDSAKPKEKREAPESLDELILARVNVQQIARMKKVNVDEVRQRAVELKVPLDAGTLGRAFYKPDKDKEDEERIKEEAEAMRLAGINTHPDVSDQQERILAIADDGVAHGDIAAVLASAYPGITAQQVTAAVKRAKKRETATTK